MIPCVALLGGSFDPVHQGHVALARLFADLLHPTELRVLPARPWQKAALQASDEDRINMLELAFRDAGLAVLIDRREIDSGKPTYTVETLRGLRAELGQDVSIVFLMGADQLQRLDSWRDWRELFELANIGVAARPGYRLEQDALPPPVAQEIAHRLAPPDQLRTTPSGLVCLAPALAVDISATQVREALQRGENPAAVPEDAATAYLARVVLDYIQQHNLYRS